MTTDRGLTPNQPFIHFVLASMANAPTLANCKDLPRHPEDPPHSAWGLYGTLNRWTDKLVADAAQDEIKHGKR
ncbi:MAG: hypothetical protein Q9173_000841 [Seirophora scorigena]